jgi:hypothetical protein
VTGPTPLPGSDLRRPARVRGPGVLVRSTVALADLLAAGVLVLGVVLLTAMVVLPSAGNGAWNETTGPGWGRVAAHLGVGLAGGTGGRLARRASPGLRIAVAVATVVAVLAVLALSWWR